MIKGITIIACSLIAAIVLIVLGSKFIPSADQQAAATAQVHAAAAQASAKPITINNNLPKENVTINVGSSNGKPANNACSQQNVAKILTTVKGQPSVKAYQLDPIPNINGYIYQGWTTTLDTVPTGITITVKTGTSAGGYITYHAGQKNAPIVPELTEIDCARAA